MSKKSDVIPSSQNKLVNFFCTGLMEGAGYDANELKKKPLIAIANSHTEMTAGHTHLDRLAGKVKEGILIEGGEYAEFNVPAPLDGVAMAHDGMRYVLAQRDLIADMVETHVRSQAFDAVVFIAGRDKINAGMMMAMGRLDLPSIYLSGGPGQMNIRNTPKFASTIDHNDYRDDPDAMYDSFSCSTCGACEIMGTANTFQCLAEALGICLPGSSNIPGWHSDKLKAARATGRRRTNDGPFSQGQCAGADPSGREPERPLGDTGPVGHRRHAGRTQGHAKGSQHGHQHGRRGNAAGCHR